MTRNPLTYGQPDRTVSPNGHNTADAPAAGSIPARRIGDNMQSSWDTIVNVLLPQIVEHFGGSIYDERRGNSWDPGQAICAEAWGPHWATHPEFVAMNNEQPDPVAPMPDVYWDAALKLARGESDWAKVKVRNT